MTEFTFTKPEPEPKFDHKQPETLFVSLDDGEVCHIAVMSDTSGFASCELRYDGCLHYMIEQACDFPAHDGHFVIEGCTGAYFRGDGWMTDDDAEFYPGTIRRATEEEIRSYA